MLTVITKSRTANVPSMVVGYVAYLCSSRDCAGMWDNQNSLSNTLQEQAPTVAGVVSVVDCSAKSVNWLFGHVGAMRPVDRQDLCIDPFASAPHLSLVACKGVPKERQKFRLLKNRLKELHGSKCLAAETDGTASLAICNGETTQVRRSNRSLFFN